MCDFLFEEELDQLSSNKNIMFEFYKNYNLIDQLPLEYCSTSRDNLFIKLLKKKDLKQAYFLLKVVDKNNIKNPAKVLLFSLWDYYLFKYVINMFKAEELMKNIDDIKKIPNFLISISKYKMNFNDYSYFYKIANLFNDKMKDHCYINFDKIIFFK